MHQPRKWWGGLTAVGALWIIAAFWKTGSTESDVQARSNAAIAAAAPGSLGEFVVSAAGRDITLQGSEFEQGDAARLAKTIDAVVGVRKVDGGLKALPVAKPFVFSATRAGGQFVLSGSIPNPGVRTRLVAAAKAAAPGSAIVDNLAYATGAPAQFEEFATRWIGEAAKLDDGAMSLSDTALSIGGLAASASLYEAAVGATRQLPAGETLAKLDIKPPVARPYAWAATSDGAQTVLTGATPSLEARAAIATAATTSLPGKVIVNQMTVAGGAPGGDFVANAAFALTELGRLGKGRVALTDSVLAVSGDVATPGLREAAMAALESLPTGLTLGKVEIAPPEVRPYVWNAGIEGDTVTLGGYAPSIEARDGLMKAAVQAFPGKQIIDKTEIARGAPANFIATAVAAMADLAAQGSGSAALTDGSLAMKAGPEGAKAPVPSATRVVADNAESAPVSPFKFTVEVANGKVKLTGSIPDEKARQDVIAAAKSTFLGGAIEDGLVIGGGAPANFAKTIASVFRPIARLTDGSLAIEGRTVSLNGHAVYEKAVEDIKVDIGKAMPPGFDLKEAALSVAASGPAVAPERCQPLFNDVLSKGSIGFETASAAISAESSALLDGLARQLIACRTADVRVEGHTDSVGSAERNLDLSKRRAQAVVDYMKSAGLDVSRVEAVGFGEERPIASNDTAEGRAANRRIDFIVK